MKEEKINMNKILVDMHTHLNEKKVNPLDWWNAVTKKKLSAVAITEHPKYNPKDAYQKLKQTKPKNVILIPGIEASTSAGDLLIFGENEKIYEIKELVEEKIDIEKILKIIKKNKLVAVFPHPYGYKHDSVCEVIGEKKAINLIKKYGVGVEYYNGLLGSANELLFGRKITKRVQSTLSFVEQNKLTTKLKISKTINLPKQKMEELSLEIFEKVKKGMELANHAKFVSVGSDAHYPHAIGTAVIELKKKPRKEKDVLNSIKKKEVLWMGPNIYSTTPVDKVGTKEMLEGLTYLIKKGVIDEKIVKKVKKEKKSKKIWVSKRIKTIKRITKKRGTKNKQVKKTKKKIKKKFSKIKNKLVLRK